jgi:hypothetical protein
MIISRLSKEAYGGEESCRVLVGKPVGRRLLGRPRLRWADNINVDLMEVGWEDADWVGLVQHRDKWPAVVNAVMNLQI